MGQVGGQQLPPLVSMKCTEPRRAMEGGGGPFICGRDETGRTDTVSCPTPAPAEAEVPVSVG